MIGFLKKSSVAILKHATIQNLNIDHIGLFQLKRLKGIAPAMNNNLTIEESAKLTCEWELTCQTGDES